MGGRGNSLLTWKEFTHHHTLENMQEIPDSVQIFVAEQSEKLADFPVTKIMVEKKDR